MSPSGRRIEIRGTVQGVGFRPWVYRVAREAGISGRVRNDPLGVTIEAFGGDGALDDFVARLRSQAPPPAQVRDVRAVPIPPEATSDFVIEASTLGGHRALSIPPDLATCDDCMREVTDPGDRRYHYPFTNCTRCGPRFTIATGVPYDRPATTMAPFEMCPDCRREYDDAGDRRFHAQPNACPACGPRLTLLAPNGSLLQTDDPLAAAAARISAGAIVAVKGLGGFHLACDAGRAEAVDELRRRKHRDAKPFAVMVRDLQTARALARLTSDDEALLVRPERPIVLVPRRSDAPISRTVAPDTELLGLMLPYTPVHHLLLTLVDRPLVMTSANLAEEPICADNSEACRRLGDIVDALLVHDREIATRCDDSVARVIAGHPTVMRRSRGYVPRPIALAHAVSAPVLACGAELKNTFCLADRDTAYLGPHIGDLSNLDALDHFETAVARMEGILSRSPEIVAHDLHPGYLSTRYARSRPEPIKVAVQHHHAHVVSAMAEHRLEGPVLGVAYDGTGYGLDGTSWGGELLLARVDRFARLATFRPIVLAGGDRAIREVWRIALAVLDDAYYGDPPIDDLALFQHVPEHWKRVVRQMIAGGLNAPRAHGVGRYFDAIGALVLDRAESRFEGQVAVAWAEVADPTERRSYPYRIDAGGAVSEVDLRPLVRAVVRDLGERVAAPTISARFHNAIASATVDIVRAAARQTERVPVVLTGGVFQNRRLAEKVLADLSSELDVYLHGEIPPGDGGIALGQALVADAVAHRRM